MPRFTSSHLGTHNRAVGGLHKSFTSLHDEFLFVDMNTRGILATMRAADALRRIVPLGIAGVIAFFGARFAPSRTAIGTAVFRHAEGFKRFITESEKYRAQFDMAARYVYLAAKAYDYETTLLDWSGMAGQNFLRDPNLARVAIDRIGKTLRHRTGLTRGIDQRIAANWTALASLGDTLGLVYTTDGRVKGFTKVTRDITSRHEQEERLRLAATVFRSTQEGVAITDSGGHVLAPERLAQT